MRKASLILSITPFGITIAMLSLMSYAEGFDGLRVLIFLFFSFPALMLMSITSLVLAYRKTKELTNDKAAKVMSIVSSIVFGGLGSFSLFMLLASQAAYSQYPN